MMFLGTKRSHNSYSQQQQIKKATRWYYSSRLVEFTVEFVAVIIVNVLGMTYFYLLNYTWREAVRPPWLVVQNHQNAGGKPHQHHQSQNSGEKRVLTTRASYYRKWSRTAHWILSSLVSSIRSTVSILVIGVSGLLDMYQYSYHNKQHIQYRICSYS